MEAKDVIYAEAMEVMASAHGTNEFYSLEEAQARFHAVVNMAEVLDLITEVEVCVVKAAAKAAYLNDN